MDRNLDLNFDAETVERCLKLFKESYLLGRTTKPSHILSSGINNTDTDLHLQQKPYLDDAAGIMIYTSKIV